MLAQSGIQEIFAATGPIFLLIAVGYAAVSFKLFPKEGVRFLSLFAVTFALPALMFKSISERPFMEILHVPYLLAYTVGSFVAFGAVYFVSRKFGGKNLTTGAIYGMGGSLSNSLIIGYPIALQLLGPDVAIPLALTLVVENLIIMPLTLAMADIGQNEKTSFWKSVVKTLPVMLKNPIILGILTGFVFSILGWGLPSQPDRIVEILSLSVSGITLFAVGGMLVGLQVKGLFVDVSKIMTAKLVLHPVAIFVAFMLVPGIDPVFAMTAVMFASMPMFGIYPILGERYGLGAVCAAALVPTMALSFVTINAIIWMMGVYSPFG